MNRRHTIIIFFLSSILFSCTSTTVVTIHKDGSAAVQTDPIAPNDKQVIKKYYKSVTISHIDTNSYLLTFDINNIDSLGNYLPTFQEGYFQFKLDSSVLTLTDGHTNAFKTNCCFCCGLYMFIKFDNGIKEIESTNRLVRKKNWNTVLIKKSRRQFIKNKKRINVIVKANS